MLFWSSSALAIAARAGLSKRLLILDVWDECARRLPDELELGKLGNVVFFTRFNLVILAIRNSLGSYRS